MDKDQARTTLMGINLVIAVGFLLFPRLSMRLYGLDPEQNRAAAYPIRYFGARSAVFAAMLADPDGTELLLKQLPLIAGTDAAANALAAASGEVPKRAVVLGALTSAAGVVLSLVMRK